MHARPVAVMHDRSVAVMHDRSVAVMHDRSVAVMHDRSVALLPLVVLLVSLATAFSSPRARAQETDAQQRQAAADAFDRGTAAYIARDYATAAEWFETANRLSPAPAAIVQAIRAHDRAGNLLRAANLAILMAQRYPHMPETPRTTEPIARRAAPAFVTVVANCDANLDDGVDACRLDADGVLFEGTTVLVEPGAEHTITAHYDTGSVTQTVTGAAGERRELTFAAPAPPPPEPPPHGSETNGSGTSHGDSIAPPPNHVQPPAPSRPPLSPVVVLLGAGVTAALVGITVWSGIDTLSGVDAYEANPTQSALEDGQAKELRTNVLIGASALVAAAVGVMALFLTDWSSSSEQRGDARPSVQAGLVALPSGGAAQLGVTF